MYYIKFDIFFFIIIYLNFVQTNITKFPFNTVVTFGDSNTDTGNVYNLTNHQWPLVPPYYKGRFTNGPVWIENLGISNIMNYAYGDATIDNNNLITGYTGPNRQRVPGIRQQIVQYLTNNDISTVDLSHTLYVIWASGNEYIINSSISSDTVVASLIMTVYDLLVVGIQHLIVINLPPLELFPGINKNEIFNTLTIEHNEHLLSNITDIQLEYPKVSLQIFDLYSLITSILLNNSYNISNKIDKCWNIINNSIISQCINPDDYIFIDDYHFTKIIHQIISNNIQKFILSSSSRIFSIKKISFFLYIILYIIQKEKEILI